MKQITKLNKSDIRALNMIVDKQHASLSGTSVLAIVIECLTIKQWDAQTSKVQDQITKAVCDRHKANSITYMSVINGMI